MSGYGNADIVTHTAWINATGDRQTFKINWYSLEGSVFKKQNTIYEETKSGVYRYFSGTYHFTDALDLFDLQAPDINGDGLSDIAYRINSVTWRYAINTGAGFKPIKNIFPANAETPAALNYQSTAFFDVNRDGSKDFVWFKYNPANKFHEVYVRYWNSKTESFLDSVLLRKTLGRPYLFADMNGDNWLDVVEFNQKEAEDHRNVYGYLGEYLKIYGYTNDLDANSDSNSGVLAQDTVTGVKVGTNTTAAVDYQTLVRPARQITSTCTTRYSNQPVTCQDHWGASQYRPHKVEIGFNPASLDGISVDSQSFYKKIHEPFAGLANSYFGEAKVSQLIAPLPIVTRLKTTLTSGAGVSVVEDKKYNYWVMREQAGGRGLLGFEKTVVEDLLAGTQIETTWRQDWPYTGLKASVLKFNKAKLFENIVQVDYQASPHAVNKGSFKLHSQTVETVYGTDVSNVPVEKRYFSNHALERIESLGNSESSSSTSSIGSAQQYPYVAIVSPNLLEVHSLSTHVELPLLSQPWAALNKALVNQDGTNPKVHYTINGVLQTDLRPDPSSKIKWWTPPRSGDFSVEAYATLDSGQVLRSSPHVFRLTKSGAPIVGLTKPTAEKTIHLGDSIDFIALAQAQNNSTIKRVKFFVDGAEVGLSDDFPPYATLWKPSAAGRYAISAVAIDSLGNEVTTAGRIVTVLPMSSVPQSSASSSQAPPIVRLLSPSGAFAPPIGLTAEYPLLATVNTASGSTWLDNDDQPAKIDFYANNLLLKDLRKDKSGPIMWWRPDAAGVYSIKAVAHLGGGRTAESASGTLRVNNVNAPQVTLTSPTQDRFLKLGDSLNLTAVATDNDGDLLWVNFLVNNNALLVDPIQGAGPYNLTWTPDVTGEYLINALAMDKTHVKSTSNTIRISVVNPGLKPTVKLINPNNATVPFGSTLTLSADALDYDGTISKVEFYANEQLVGTTTAHPYQVNFTLPSVGSYTLKAIAYDNLDNSSVSALSSVQYGFANPTLHPMIITPTGTIQTTTPKFAAVESSLLSGVVYGVAISESPRTGTYGQYVDWWVKTDLTANDLVESNPSGLVWNSGWQQRTRNGNPDGPPIVVGNSSPLSLTPGKTYYWHIVGDNGTYKSEQASFTVDVNAQPSVNGSGNFDFKAVENIRNVKFDLTWKPQAGHTRYELWKRSALRLPDLYDENKWTRYSVSQAEYNAGGISIPFNSMPDDVYAQWKLVVCDAASVCSSQLSRVKVIHHDPVVTSTTTLSPVNNSVVDFDKEQNNLCFNWSRDSNAVAYKVTFSDTQEFYERRWQQVVDKGATNLCLGNLSDWNRTGVYRSELADELRIGGVYYWRLAIVYADGREGFTNTNQFTLNNNLPTLSVTTDVILQSFKLEWNKVSGAHSYQLQVRVGSSVAELESASPRTITLPNQLITSIDESMASYKDYAMIQWQVRACQSASNCGVWQKSRIKANQYGFNAPGVSLLAPIRLASIDVAIDKTKPCFKWASDSNATDYVVFVSDTTEFSERSWTKAISGATTTCWDNESGWARAGIYKDELQDGLYRGFKYYWRVVSRYSNGTLGFSQTYSFDITDSSTPVIALLSPKPLESERVFVGSNVPVMANVFDNYMRTWRNLDGRPPVVDYYINNTQLPKGFRIPAGTPVNWFADKAGVYKLKAVAYLDDAKTLKTFEADVTVVEPQKPSIAIQVNGSAGVGSTTELKVVATDPDQQIEEVSFFANGEPIGKASNQPPYATKWTPVVAGNYQLTAKLLDKKGNEVVSPAVTALVQPTLFSLDGIDKPSEFGATSAAKGWLVKPLAVSDVLSVKPANNHRISYNKLDQLILNRPLKIINRSDVYDNGIVPQLIVLDADLVDLKSGIEIIGEPADLLIINNSASNAIRCDNCGFTNVGRAVLAVATPSTALSSAIATVGELQTRAAGVVDINNLQASGVVSLEIIADKVIAKGHIDTQQYARQSSEFSDATKKVEQVLDFVAKPLINSVVVGSGGVSLLQGNLRVKYETMELENTVAGTGVMAVDAAISSGAINVFATDAIQLNGNLSTKSSHRAAQIYRGQLRAQEEKIELKSIAQASVAPSLRINGLVFSDAKVAVIGHSAEIAPNAGIQAHSVKSVLTGQLTNRGYIRGYSRATAENAPNGDAMIELGAGSLDNRGAIRGVFNDLRAVGGNTSVEGKINIASEGDVYNRFGGVISAKEIKVFAKGKIRNGSLFAFDATAVGGKESTTAIHLAPHDTSRLSTHSELAFPANELPLKNTQASIVGQDVTLEATQSVENINPYTEPYTASGVEISTLSADVEQHANDVEIEATQKLQIFSSTYVLNSSAKMGVSQAGSAHRFLIKAPKIRNERYFSNMISETFSDFSEVKAQANGKDAILTDWAKGVQSRYGFYSPPGYIYSFATAEINFGSGGDGMLNNISFVDFYSDLKVFGQGQITTRGMSLEKLSYSSGSTIQVSIPECRYYYNSQGNGYNQCVPRSTYSSTPEGKLLKQSPDNTLFAVNGQINAPANMFHARNDQSLTVLRKELVIDYIERQKVVAAKDHTNDIKVGDMDPACTQSVEFTEKDNLLVGKRFQYSDNSQIRCYHKRAFMASNPNAYGVPSTWTTSFGYKNITDLVNENIPGMGSALNQKINEYRAWRAAAK